MTITDFNKMTFEIFKTVKQRGIKFKKFNPPFKFFFQHVNIISKINE